MNEPIHPHPDTEESCISDSFQLVPEIYNRLDLWPEWAIRAVRCGIIRQQSIYDWGCLNDKNCLQDLAVNDWLAIDDKGVIRLSTIKEKSFEYKKIKENAFPADAIASNTFILYACSPAVDLLRIDVADVVAKVRKVWFSKNGYVIHWKDEFIRTFDYPFSEDVDLPFDMALVCDYETAMKFKNKWEKDIKKAMLNNKEWRSNILQQVSYIMRATGQRIVNYD